MRRLVILLLALGLPVLPLAAAPPAAASVAYRITFSGELAVGEWSTCPTWTLGDHCLFTRVIVGNARSHETNDYLYPGRLGHYLRTSGPSFVLQRSWFDVVELDGELAALTTKESFGGVGVPGFPGTAGNPVVRIDNRLRTATATATDIRVHTTDYTTPDGTETWGNASADTRWVKAGPLDRNREGRIWRSEQASMRGSTTGWQRDASATAVGRTPAGTFLGGFMLHAVQRETEGFHGQLRSEVSSAIRTLTTGRAEIAPLLTRTQLSARHGEASWTTCPQPQTGDRCRDVVVAYDAVTAATGEAERYAYIGVYDYRVVEVTEDWVDTVAIASVDTYAPVTSLVAPADLAGVDLTVTGAEASLCDSDFDCTTTSVSVSAAWTGTGDARRFRSHAVMWGDWGREWARTVGHTRDATASATVSGLPAALHMNGPVGGTLVSASIASSRERHSAIERR
jgi:hypothetical protein